MSHGSSCQSSNLPMSHNIFFFLSHLIYLMSHGSSCQRVNLPMNHNIFFLSHLVMVNLMTHGTSCQRVNINMSHNFVFFESPDLPTEPRQLLLKSPFLYKPQHFLF
jgi:hypothetical protein